MDPIVHLRDEGQQLRGPAGGPLTFKVRGADTGGALTAFENEIAPGDGPPLHAHAVEGESWQILEGTLRFRLHDEVRLAPVGTFVHVPAGTPHCFQNIGDDTARILVLFTPAGMESFFDGFAQLGPGEAGPSAFARLGEPAGMTVLGPPLAVSDPL